MLILYLQDITINCESVKSREFKLNSSTEYLDHNSYINNLLPYNNYTIQVKVTNNKDLSTEDTLVIETWELGINRLLLIFTIENAMSNFVY